MKKKMMALALALVMTGSLAACGGGGSTSTTAASGGRFQPASSQHNHPGTSGRSTIMGAAHP